MYSWTLICKNQFRSDYRFKEEFEHKVLFPSHFYDVEMNYILEIPKLLFTLSRLPELSQVAQFKLFLGLPVNPMSQSHQQCSLHDDCLSGHELQWTN